MVGLLDLQTFSRCFVFERYIVQLEENAISLIATASLPECGLKFQETAVIFEQIIRSVRWQFVVNRHVSAMILM